jgi:predicted NUDIX family phosphoesterase
VAIPSPSATEQVLVVPAELLKNAGYFQGFTARVEQYLPLLLDPEHISFRPRPAMEQDPRFKQLIPYVIFRYCDEAGETFLFQYTRGHGQQERRLHALRSIGIGGHISQADALGDDPYHAGVQRELEEEVVIETAFRQRMVGLINDDQTEVGRVHLGVVHLVDVEAPRVRPRESDLVDAGFRPLGTLIAELSQFETWSQICLKALFL